MDERSTVGNDLLRAAARLTRWATRNASFEVPYAQARLLALLDELGPSRVSALAEADHSSQPSMTAALQRLESQGWAQREPDPSDARATLLSLSRAGRKALYEVRAARLDALSPTLDALSDSDIAVLREAITVMESLVHPVPVSTTPTLRKEA
ncbi:MarR family winged helix-turn-helix transcriptional regulator [Pedococcus sp. 5OH_020]|uniref:MarR family winged helix-turn-helix transcriptional regulator n=1 Tax=Pedococcus sp. 5OH_020 TaxID=2989814 RepID=UPI0022E9FA17|nr:MarR family transcriptional regulator [Pedococcus sp. 5OH_020]